MTTQFPDVVPAPQVLCKPKIMPLKSINLEKLEEMEARGPTPSAMSDVPYLLLLLPC